MTEVEDFEHEVESLIGCKYARAVNNGTAALKSALKACQIEPGDKIITTPYTFVATCNAILNVGATPVFVDIDPETLCLDADLVWTMLNLYVNAQAILTVDLFGKFADMDRLRASADRHGIPLIEDASQAFGAWYGERYAGTIGDVGTFSFYASKNLSTFEGGMVVTDDHSIADYVEMYRNHGFNDYGDMVILGENLKMPRLLALIGSTNLRLHKKGILAEVGNYSWKDGYYPKLVYQHPYYKERGIVGHCPVAEEMAARVAKL